MSHGGRSQLSEMVSNHGCRWIGKPEWGGRDS
jgi:hypothetical protein